VISTVYVEPEEFSHASFRFVQSLTLSEIASFFRIFTLLDMVLSSFYLLFLRDDAA